MTPDAMEFHCAHAHKSAMRLRIAKRRAELGMSQEDLAEVLGVDQATVSRYENGKQMPRGKRLQQIARALNTTTRGLVEEEAATALDAALLAAASRLDDEQKRLLVEMARQMASGRT